MRSPHELKRVHHEIALCADLMYVQGVGFLVTVSKNIKFVTICDIPNRKKETLLNGLDHTFRIYNKAGFVITDLHADQEFECLRQELMDDDNGIELHCVARNKHEPTVENMIKTIKERVRCLWHQLPYTTMPKIMLQYLVKNASQMA